MIVIKTIDIGQILQPGNIVAWLLVGLIAGSLAAYFVRGRGFGCFGNIIVGLLGSVIGGILASILELGTFRFCGSIFISFIGACILLGLLQLLTGGTRR
ncbi:MAG TPA: GlsB/YeaQ/YmgE family stress response membrane protein [Ktedonobacteraceae bacterium]|nr:GlsB/YeaQ/YmgE family stress response membrane protein [Ktedonobacteraceae bacterium]